MVEEGHHMCVEAAYDWLMVACVTSVYYTWDERHSKLWCLKVLPFDRVLAGVRPSLCSGAVRCS
jgi:hypothetical protein